MKAVFSKEHNEEQYYTFHTADNRVVRIKKKDKYTTMLLYLIAYLRRQILALNTDFFTYLGKEGYIKRERIKLKIQIATNQIEVLRAILRDRELNNG